MGGFRECAGRGDHTRCPHGADASAGDVRCDDCREHYEQDPGRPMVEDDSLTRPTGDPREAGHGTAA
ncbi:hypothetical protein [Streptomyces bluensis]|uniref:Uncharacterized protein n=2 Tax=Streptomyces bluensis TaxID=33897 RepID=A0ABW6UU51_9ACTN